MNDEHPTISELELYLEGDGERGVSEHVAGCETCSGRLAELGSMQSLLDELAEAVHEDELHGDLPPPVVPGFDELVEVSRGGQGAVFRALQRATHRTVAIKVLLGGAFSTARRRGRFEREVELVAGLRHPNIVTIHDSGVTADGSHWFAMEYVDGTPANRWATPRPLREVLAAFASIAEAVDFAHRRGVLHRDLKAGNVLIDDEGEPHVLDFGLAVTREGSTATEATQLTLSGEVMGTLAYASPEHVSGDPHRIDVRSDVYSLGVMLWEAVTGDFPYPIDGSPIEIARHIAESEPRVTDRPGELDFDLETVLRCALAKDPERRYATAGALAADLRRYLSGQVLDARRDSTWYVLRKTLRRHRLEASAAAAIFVLALGAAVGFRVLWKRSEGQRVTAEVQGEKASEISGFFVSVLDSIDPDAARGRAVEVREVLDEAARRLDTTPPSSAEAEMELRATIGNAFASLGLFAEAAPHLREAVRLASSLLGEQADQTIGLSLDLAHTESIVSPRAVAEGHLERVLAALESGSLPDSPETRLTRARTMQLLGRLDLRGGRRQRAGERFHEALAIVREVVGEHDRLVAQLLLELADLEAFVGSLDASEAHAREALAVFLAIGDDQSIGVAVSAQLIGTALLERGRPREAETELARAHGIFTVRLAPDHAQTVQALTRLAFATARGQGGAADELYSRALALRPSLANALDARAADALNNMGNLAFARGDYRLAGELHSQALEQCAGRYEPGSLFEAVVKTNLAWDWIRSGSPKLGLALAEGALETIDATIGPDSLPAANALWAIAWARVGTGDIGRTHEPLARALQLRREILGDSNPMTLDTRVDVAVLRYWAGRPVEAIELLEGVADAAPADSHPDLRARALHHLGEVLRDSGRSIEALEPLEEALFLRRSALGERHPDVAESLNAIGLAKGYLRTDRDVQLELYEQALDILRDQGPDFPRTTWVLNNLGRWYLEAEDPAANERAGVYLDEAVERGLRLSHLGHPLLGLTLGHAGVLERRRGNEELAVERFGLAYEILVRAWGDQNPRARQILGFYVEALAAAGDPREQEFRARLDPDGDAGKDG